MSKKALTLDLATGRQVLSTVIDDATNAAGKEDVAYSAKAVDDKVSAISSQIGGAITDLKTKATYQNAVLDIFPTTTAAEAAGAVDNGRYIIGDKVQLFHAGTPSSWEVLYSITEGATVVSLKDYKEYRYKSTLANAGYNATNFFCTLDNDGVVHKTGDETIDGQKEFVQNTTFDKSVTVGQNLTVTGDLVIKGQTTQIETQNLVVKDNVVVLNDGDNGKADGSGISLGTAGIEINRGTTDGVATSDKLPKAQLIFDETSKTWKIGTETDLLNVARIDDTATTSAVKTYSIDKINSISDALKAYANNSTLFSYVADGTISTGDIVYVKSNGRVDLADNTNVDCMNKLAGVAVKAATAGQPIQVAKFGKINKFADLTAGVSYFLGTNGKLTNTCPSAVGSFINLMGVATDDATVLLQIGDSILIQ